MPTLGVTVPSAGPAPVQGFADPAPRVQAAVPPAPDRRPTRSDGLRSVRRHWLLVLACLVAALGVGVVLVDRATRYYSTSITLFVTTQADVTSPSSAYAGTLFTQQRLESYADLVESPLLVRRVIDRLDVALSEPAMRAKLSASADAGSTLLTVTVTDEFPARAQRIANAVGIEFSLVANALERPPGGRIAPIRVTFAEEARLPRSPVTPRPWSDLPLAGLIGLVMGAGAAVVRERTDDAVTSPDDVQEATGHAILGVVPDDPSAPSHPLALYAASRQRAEAFRMLRTNLRFVGVDTRPRSIAVTSPTPGEGKTTTTCNLGISLAQAGLRVVVVDCDLHQPRVADYFGIESAAGVTTVLTRQATLDDVIQSWPTGPLDVVASGPVPPNPGELLGSHAMRALVATLEERYDVVLLDTPPLLAVADAAVVAVATSGAVLVVRHGKTRRDQLREARRSLEAVGARLFGTVLNRTPRTGRDATYLGYGYGYHDAPYAKTAAAPEASRPSFLGQAIGTTISQGVLLALTAASSIMAARFLGATGRGALTAASLGPGLVVALLGLGFEISNVFFVGRRTVKPETAFGTSMVLGALLAIPGLAAYFAVVSAVRTSALRGISWPMVVAGSLLIPLMLLTRYATGVAQGLRRIAVVNLSNIGGTFTTVVLYAVLLGALGAGPLAALVAVVAGAAVSAAIIVRELLRRLPRPRFDRSFAAKGLRFGVRGYVGNVITMLTYRIDVFIVTAIVGLAAAGQYAVAYTTTELLWQIPNAIAMILFPRVAQAGEDGAVVTARLCRLSLAGTALLAVAGALMAPSGIPFLFSAEFRPAVPALIWLLPGIVLFAAGKLLAAYLTGRGRPDLPSRAAVVTLPIVVVLNLLLVPPLGIVGAAVASTIAYSGGALLLAAMFVRHSGLPWSSLWLPRWSDLRIVGGAARQLVQARRAGGTP